MTKLDRANWAQLDFLINNFYEIVEYKRGRGVYGDRVVLKRYKDAKAIFGEPAKLCDFYYLDAHAVKELPMTTRLKVANIAKLVTSPADMNTLCDCTTDIDPTIWAVETKDMFNVSLKNGVDYNELNSILLSQYGKLPNEFITNLQTHRQKQYKVAHLLELIPEEYATKQLSREFAEEQQLIV